MRYYNTLDLSKFGSRERQLAAELLLAWNEQGLPENFIDEEVNITFNTYSGCVFISNEYDQIAMINPMTEKLEQFYEMGDGVDGYHSEILERYENGEFDEDIELKETVESFLGIEIEKE